MFGKNLETYRYDENYPYLQEMKRNSGKLSYDLWITIRAFNEVYFPLGLIPGDRILDVGACTGNLGQALKLGGVITYDTDINFASLQLGQHIFGPSNRISAAATTLPFQDGFFDFVVSQDLFEHLPDLHQAEIAFHEMERTVCGNGRMLHKITVLEDVELIDADESHRIKLSSDEWHQWFQDRNWTVISPTKKRLPVWTRHKIGLGKIYGYFLLQRSNFLKSNHTLS